ncbi:MAG: putative entry exclusion protein TrbK-alt [Sphingomonas sp.]
MSRAVKLVGVAVLAGLMTAVIATTESSPPASPVTVPPAVGAPDTPMRPAALDRCRGTSAPDTGCAAAWDAERRRFFEGAGR